MPAQLVIAAALIEPVVAVRNVNQLSGHRVRNFGEANDHRQNDDRRNENQLGGDHDALLVIQQFLEELQHLELRLIPES